MRHNQPNMIARYRGDNGEIRGRDYNKIWKHEENRNQEKYKAKREGGGDEWTIRRWGVKGREGRSRG